MSGFSIVQGHENDGSPANKTERNKNPAVQYNVLSLHLRVLESWEIHVCSLLFIRHNTNSSAISHTYSVAEARFDKTAMYSAYKIKVG